jgi:tetratricopeptide (TPR) repeat protein
VTGYRLASGLDASGSPEAAADAGNVWSWTLGALVAGLYAPDVWGRTASVSGRPLAPGQVGRARGLLIERLGDDLRALDLAAGRSGGEVGAWSTRVGMELRCAEAFAQEDLRITLGDGPARRLILGPALLRLLLAANARTDADDVDAAGSPALADWLARYEQAVAPYADGSKRATLTDVFGLLHPRLGAQRFLVLQDRFADAVAALDAVAPESQDADHLALLAEALVREGERLYRDTAWEGSLAAFVRAGRLGVRELSGEQARMAADCGLYASSALLSESATREQRARAVLLLEQAIGLSPDTEQTQRLLGEFAAASVQLARRLAEEREHEQAGAVLRSTLERVPGDDAAGEALGVVLAEHAELLGRDGSVEGLARSVELWREAAGHHPDIAYARAGLAGALGLAARRAALAGDRAAAVALMSESVGLGPEREPDRGHGPDGGSGWPCPDPDTAAELHPDGEPGGSGPVEDLDADGEPDEPDEPNPVEDPDPDPTTLVLGRISAALLAYAVGDLADAPFPERLEVLRLARSFEDSPRVRGALCGQLRAQARLLAQAGEMAEAERLLVEALELAAGLPVLEETTAQLAAVYRAHAIEASASRRRRREAAEAIGRAAQLLPDDEDLQALRRSIESPG